MQRRQFVPGLDKLEIRVPLSTLVAAVVRDDVPPPDPEPDPGPFPFPPRTGQTSPVQK